MYKRVLVTGGHGFLGKHLVKTLYPSVVGSAPSSDALDITNEDKVKFHLKSFQPEIIYHLAAISSPSADVSEDKMWRTNVDGTRYLLEHAPVGCRFIFASSVVVYGTTPFPVHEYCSTMYPTSYYGLTKAVGESLVSMYSRMNKVNGTSVRLCAIVGEGMTHGALKDIIRKAKVDTNTLELMGKAPGSIKPYLHVSDAVNAIIAIAKLNYADILNVTPCDSISIETMARLVVSTVSPNEKTFTWTGQTFKGDNTEININSDALCQYYRLRFPTSRAAIMQAISEEAFQR